MEQIHEEYNGQWVFLIHCKQNEYGSVIGGEVVLHSEARERVASKMNDYSRNNGVFFLCYAGQVPEGVEVLLSSQ